MEATPLSVSRQCKLLGISRSSLYYKAKGESELNQKLRSLILDYHKDHPAEGQDKIFEYLRLDKGYKINRKRIKRLCKSMNIRAVIPKRNLSKPNESDQKYPYLLKDMNIISPKQVYQTDITYIPMRKGFMYLTSVIDVYSRKIMAWDISNSMTAQWCRDVIKSATEAYGKPEIVNTDQGSQYTSHIFLDYLKDNGIQISMDGKGRALDNIYIERFWKSIKYEDIKLKAYETGTELWHGIKNYINYYNTGRRHQSLGYKRPDDIYYEYKARQEMQSS